MADAKVEELPERVDVASSLPAVTDGERELAQQATDEFEAGHYDACASFLQKLSATRSSDPRLLHNKAVVDFYWSGCTKTIEYKQAIAEVSHTAKKLFCVQTFVKQNGQTILQQVMVEGVLSVCKCCQGLIGILSAVHHVNLFIL